MAPNRIGGRIGRARNGMRLRSEHADLVSHGLQMRQPRGDAVRGPHRGGAGGTSCDDVPVTLALLLASASLYVVGYLAGRSGGTTFGRARLGAFLAGIAALRRRPRVAPGARRRTVVHRARRPAPRRSRSFAPPLLALGAPVALALRAAPPGTRRSDHSGPPDPCRDGAHQPHRGMDAVRRHAVRLPPDVAVRRRHPQHAGAHRRARGPARRRR